MRLSYFTLLFLLLTAHNAAFTQLNFTATNNGRSMQLADLNGNSLLSEKYDPAIEGTPFLNNEWAAADLTLKAGKVLQKVSVKLNIESNELYFLDSSDITLVSVPGNVKKISFTSLRSKDEGLYLFKCGYPSIEKQTENYYYQVLSEGKIELLKRNFKTIETFKNEMSGDKRKEFTENSRYYFFSPKGIEPFQNAKEYLLDLMQDKEDLVQTYLGTNKISFKKIADLQKLINHYNSLK